MQPLRCHHSPKNRFARECSVCAQLAEAADKEARVTVDLAVRCCLTNIEDFGDRIGNFHEELLRLDDAIDTDRNRDDEPIETERNKEALCDAWSFVVVKMFEAARQAEFDRLIATATGEAYDLRFPWIRAQKPCTALMVIS